MIVKGNVYYRQEPRTGRYFAFQITDIDGKGGVVCLLLDYFGECPPGLSDLDVMKPFIRRRWWWSLSDAVSYCNARVVDFPKDAVPVGNMLPLMTTECRTYGGFPSGMDFPEEAKWMAFPEETRRRFKEGIKDSSEVVVAGITLRRSWQVVDDALLSAMTDYNKELWELPVANLFKATRYYPQLIPFLETRHTATKLEWSNHGQKSPDLSRTHLKEITLCDTNMEEVLLPDSCNQLKLEGKIHADLKIKPAGNGRDLNVTVDMSKQDNLLPDFNIPALGGLILTRVDGVDLAPVANMYPHLVWLKIIGGPGNVVNINSLGGLSELETLAMDDVFGFTSDEFPQPADFPKLKNLWLESVPEEAGRGIKKRFKGKTDDLDIRKLRKPEWLAENLDNPLRHWDGSEFVPRSKALKAARIYRDTRKSATAAAEAFLADKDADKLSAGLNETAKEWALTFNKLDGKMAFIETEEREDLYGAFDIILSAVGELVSGTGFNIDASRIYEVLDEHRDW